MRLNVLDEKENKSLSIDWKENVIEWKEVEPEEVLVSFVYSMEQMEAMFVELEKWREYEVFEAENVGQKLISTRWVLTSKDGKTKARLVARGFEDSDIDNRTDSPTCSKMNLRMVITIAASKSWKINSLDIQSAYLQGQTVERALVINFKITQKLAKTSQNHPKLAKNHPKLAKNQPKLAKTSQKLSQN